MASTLLEQARAAHEKMERLEALIVSDMLQRPKGQLPRMAQEHRTNRRILDMIEADKFLIKIYDDDDGARREEIQGMAPGNIDRIFETFYDRLKDTRAYYRKFPNLAFAENPLDNELENLDVDLLFSGEECDGRFVDLHELHDKYLNMKQFEKMDYATYLDNFYRFDKISADRKNNQYAKYLQELCDYLVSFYERTNPLDNLKVLLERVEKSCRDKHKEMEQQKIEIKKEDDDNTSKPSKELYCGVCKQVFSKLTVYQAHMASKRHKTAASKTQINDDTDQGSNKENIRILEAKISMLSDQLAGVIQASKANVEKRLSMTWEELEASRETEGQEYQEIVPEDKEEKDSDSENEEKNMES